MIEDDDLVVLREMQDLLPPAGSVAAAAVGQHDSGTLAMYLVVYTRAPFVSNFGMLASLFGFGPRKIGEIGTNSPPTRDFIFVYVSSDQCFVGSHNAGE